MGTVFEPVPRPVKITESAFVPQLERIAPGVTHLIEQAAILSESWWTTLERILSSVTTTPEQDAQLMAIARHAAEVEKPVQNVMPESTAPREPITAEKFLTYASVASLLYRILF